MADVNFQISGENGALLTAFQESQQAAQAAAAGIQESFGKVGEIFESLTSALGVFTAALAGGKMFKDAVDASADLVKGATGLAHQFGITTTQASDLRVALEDVHISTDTFAAAGNALIKNLNSNEQGFRNFGIATRDASGHLRGQLDILLDTTSKLSTLREGTDRNIEGQRLFGKSWAEMAPVVKLTSQVMDDATAKAKALGLQVGTEEVKAYQKWAAAQVEVNDVMLAVKNVIGQAVIPVLTQLGEWFAGYGPQIVTSFRLVLAGLSVTIQGFALTCRMAFATATSAFAELSTGFSAYGAAFTKALHGDFSGAQATWTAGMEKMRQIGVDYRAKIVADATETNKEMADALSKAWNGPTVTPTSDPSGARTDPDDTAKRKELLEQLADFAQELDTRVTNQHAAAIAQLTALDMKQAEEEEKQKQDLYNFAEQLDQKATQEHAKSLETLNSFNARIAKEYQQTWEKAANSAANAITGAMTQMLNGTFNLRSTMLNIGQSLLTGLVRNIIVGEARFLAAEQAKAAAAVVSGQIQADASNDAAKQGLSIGGMAALKQIFNNAEQAASAAFASTAAIPYVGPVLAPIAAATAFTAVAAFGSGITSSAEGGYDIPAGVNPVTQLHQKEMVLPANLADTVRNMASNGGGSGGGDVSINVVNADANHYFIKKSDLAAVLRKQHAAFKLP